MEERKYIFFARFYYNYHDDKGNYMEIGIIDPSDYDEDNDDYYAYGCYSVYRKQYFEGDEDDYISKDMFDAMQEGGDCDMWLISEADYDFVREKWEQYDEITRVEKYFDDLDESIQQEANAIIDEVWNKIYK